MGDHLIRLLPGLAILLYPALDDLNALQFRARVALPARVHDPTDRKAWRPVDLALEQRAAHRDTAGVALRCKVALLAYPLGEVEAAKEAHDRPRATGRKGFAALQGREDGVARVLFCPDTGHAATVRLQAQKIGLVQDLARYGKAQVAVCPGLGILDRFARAGRAVMVVERTDEPEHEGIDAVLLLIPHALLQGVTDITLG